jgi:CBS domain-containing protein
VDDVAEFLSRHPPFDTLEPERLAEVARAAEPELHRAGTQILERADARSESAYVVRSGAVELVSEGRLLDVVGEGELFGFASILADTPLGFVARASEDALVYRVPAEAIRPVLERPAALSFVARTLTAPPRLLARGEPAAVPQALGRRVSELIRAPPLVCPPDTRIQDAARRMVEAGASSVLVELDGRYGIVTDRDMRTRVIAEGRGPDTALADVMSAPARTVAADRTAAEALLEMLDHGIRHLPVLDAHRRLVGVIDNVDLLAGEHRAPFRIRALIARSPDAAGVAAAAAGLAPATIALHDAGVAAPAISRMIAGVHDSATRRLIELAEEELGPPPAPFAWLATGSFGRREPFPSSDVDCALAWEGAEDPVVRAALLELARRVVDGLAACGLRPDEHGAIASRPLFARSTSGWEAAARAWMDDPDRDRGLMLLSVIVESTPVWGPATAADRLARAFTRSPGREAMLQRMGVAALAERPPIGFLRDFVLESGGVRRRALDIKRRGLLPVEAVARWAALSAGVVAASTPARLEAAGAAGTLSAADAAVLADAFELFCELRMEHQVEQLRAGRVPDDQVEPARFTPLTRGSLKRAFRAVARVQRGLRVQMGLAAR